MTPWDIYPSEARNLQLTTFCVVMTICNVNVHTLGDTAPKVCQKYVSRNFHLASFVPVKWLTYNGLGLFVIQMASKCVSSLNNLTMGFKCLPCVYLLGTLATCS